MVNRRRNGHLHMDIATRSSRTAAVVATVGASVWLSACGNVDSEPDAIETERSAVMIGGILGHQLSYVPAASEGETFAYAGSPYLAYGANGHYRFMYGAGNKMPCTNEAFGWDPAPGVVKSCFISTYTLNASEGETGMVYFGPHSVAYGANGVFNFAVVSGAYTCNQATFGRLLLPGATKKCYMGLPEYEVGAPDGGTLTGLSNTPVAYGAHGFFVHKVASGSLPCTPASFGGDPSPSGATKSCYKLLYPFAYDEYDGSLSGVYLFGSGLNGRFVITRSFTDICWLGAFPGDPHIGVLKHCYFVSPS